MKPTQLPTESLEAITRAEIEIQISTAKKYPRDLPAVLEKIKAYAKMDIETAEECFYSLRRADKNGKTKNISGIGVRMAELIANCWGNLRIQTRTINNDGKTITGVGSCHDLETNLFISVEDKRSICNRLGKTFSHDLQVLTGNAAASVAFRNSILKVVPKSVLKNILDDIREFALGSDADFESSKKDVIAYFTEKGVAEKQIIKYLGIKAIKEIDKDILFELKSLRTAVKDGTTTIKEAFVVEKAVEEKKAAIRKKRSSIKKVDLP